MLPTALQKQQAIQATLEGNWELAIAINEDLLKGNPSDIETLNRLAFAYSILGKTTQAKKAYKKVLEIDIFNPIALKILKD
jgi:Flp pilus assembly protein TadD